MIVVFSFAEEDHTLEVVRRLNTQGREVVLLDLSQFPAPASMTLAWTGVENPSFLVDGPAGPVDLAEAQVVWWRRVRPYQVEAAVHDPAVRAFALSETTQAMAGMLDSLACTWVNPRVADETAHHKPLQWTLAGQVGLRIPRTLVTSRPEAAQRFVAEVGVGRVVYKAFLAMLEAWRETRIVSEEDAARLDSVRYAPVIFQEYAPGVDLRITVVGDQVFAVEIDAQDTSYPYDMRMVFGEARVRVVELPLELEASLLRLMRRLGLVYGAIDMRRTRDDEFYFLEVNPAGQWLFVEQRTGIPISQAMADLLMRLDEPRRGR